VERHRAWWVMAAGVVLGMLVFYFVPALQRAELIISWTAGLWAVTNFLHQHELARARFFFELFNRFNERYDGLNCELASIMAGPDHATLSVNEHSTLIDYFNLCAEEYMFYRRGYIPQDVWTFWCRGMREYAANKRIMRRWQAEAASCSYYGFDLRKTLED
jgi:hypothetical protein